MNKQLMPSQIEGYRPFWMVYIDGTRPPRKKYRVLSEAIRDADALCSSRRRKAFILEVIGIMVPEGQALGPSVTSLEKEIDTSLPLCQGDSSSKEPSLGVVSEAKSDAPKPQRKLKASKKKE